MQRLPPAPTNATARWLERAPASLRAFLLEHSGGELASAVGSEPVAGTRWPLDGRLATVATPEPRQAYPQPTNRREKRAGERVQQRRVRVRKESQVAQLQRHHAKHERWLQRYRARMAALRGPERKPPPAIALDTWRACADVMHDVTGKAARVHLARLPLTWSAAIRRAALGEVAGDCARDWSSERARAITCVGLVLCHQQRRTRRRGAYTCLVRGITRGAFVACVQLGQRRRHLNTISGVHRRGAAPHSGQLGYLQALQRAGLFYRQQLPGSDPSVEPWERWSGRDGVARTANRYWLCNPNPYDGHLTSDVRAALLELAASALSFDVLRLRPRARPSSSAPPAPAEPPPAPD